jgi:predicted permease
VALVSTQLMESSFQEEAPRIAAWDRMLADVRRLAGVRSASLSALTPLDGGARRVGFTVPGFVPRIDEDRFLSLNTVSEDYFATLGTPVLRGRAFTASDTRDAPPVAVLNESAVRHFFADRDPIGVVGSLNGRRYQIVGVVQDVKQRDLRQRPGRFVYLSLRQPYDRNFRMTLAVRAAVPPASLIGSIQERLRSLGSDILVGASHTLVQQLDESLLNERLISALATAFGVLALTLAAVGLYGVLAYSVAQRRAEIAIRMALGAQRAHVAGSILTQTMWLLIIGVAVGVPLSMLFASTAASLFYGITSTDAAALEVGAATLLTVVAVVASYLPARRASRIDPLAALRCE